MTFADALTSLQAGNKLTRTAWNQVPAYITFNPAPAVNPNPLKATEGVKAPVQRTPVATFSAVLKDGRKIPVYQLMAEDLISTDWTQVT